MIDVVERVIAALVVSLLLCLSTAKMLGIMQQGGYQNKSFWRWLKRKDNLYFNRLSVLSLCLALSTAIVALCFSFLALPWGVVLSALPFMGLLLAFGAADNKYALKVSTKRTGRFVRLFGIYYFFTALCSYILIAVLAFLGELNGSKLYSTVAYVPVAVLPLLLPALLALANGVTGVFENARNKKFVKRAGQVLDETQIVRVAVVGSYGKTSVKNILKTLLSEKFSVVETPASYNTPVGIAKTVFSSEFTGKRVFIAEMGARKSGDIAELCALVKPDYAVFTGVCAQHVATFGSVDGAFAEKSEVLRCGAKKVVCGESLKERVMDCCGGSIDESISFADGSMVKDLTLGKTTRFTLALGEEYVRVETPLLGRSAVEDILLAALLAKAMGLTEKEIAKGLSKLQPVPHRLQLLENNGVYILDDGYNCNIEGAKSALEVLTALEGRGCVVTPGIVEGGILEEELNNRLGELIANSGVEKVVLVGDTLVGAVKTGYLNAGGRAENLSVVHTLAASEGVLSEWVQRGDCVLFLNDLPDVY